MAVQYEKMRSGNYTGEYVWMDEPDDIPGDDPLATQKKRHAAEIIRRMDASRKWHRVNDDDSLDGPRFVMGPEGATTDEGMPLAEAVRAGTPLAAALEDAFSKGATSAVLRTDPAGGPTQVVPAFDSGSARMESVPPNTPTPAGVRRWAGGHGLDVDPLGQGAERLTQQYMEAHGGRRGRPRAPERPHRGRVAQRPHPRLGRGVAD